MIQLKMNGLEIQAEEGWTLLEAARFYGLEIPTLCHNDGLTEFGGCRLCLVEIGEGPRSKLVSSCTYPVEEGLVVHTDTARVVRARRMMLELMLSTAPGSKKLQDLASKYGLTHQRFKPRDEECVYCGLCVRICEEQMDARAIGFQNRGNKRKISTPFDARSEVCRLCGACMYICPACQLRCQGPAAETDICNACLTMEPTCLEEYGELQCWMYDAGRCGTCVQEKRK
ncbi:MAG: 2Fe-2S iron-sulfur cluster-binding protein [Candidatus Aminicenantes bacterium]|nr:2Fe-2S iron-sulfur cluster-binding protein [Candidatus Aminicenantes bacterium]